MNGLGIINFVSVSKRGKFTTLRYKVVNYSFLIGYIGSAQSFVHDPFQGLLYISIQIQICNNKFLRSMKIERIYILHVTDLDMIPILFLSRASLE